MGRAHGERGRRAIAGAVDDVGGRVEVDLQRAIAGDAVDDNGVAAAAAGHAGDGARGGTGAGQGEIVGGHATHRLAEGDAEAHRGIRRGRAAGRRDGAHIDDQGLVRAKRVGRARHGQGQGGSVAGRVLDGAAVERQRGGGNVIQVGAGFAGLHRVVERQRAGAAATGVVDRAVGGAGFQGQLRGAGDCHRLAEIDLDRNNLAGLVGAVGGTGGHPGNRGRHAVDDEVPVRAQRAGRARRRQRQQRIVARQVLDGAAVEGQGAGGHVVQIGAGIAGLHGVAESQGAAVGTAGVVDDAVGGAGFQGQLRRAGDQHGLAETDLDIDDLTHLVRAVGGARGHVGHRRRRGVGRPHIADIDVVDGEEIDRPSTGQGDAELVDADKRWAHRAQRPVGATGIGERERLAGAGNRVAIDVAGDEEVDRVPCTRRVVGRRELEAG